VAGEEFLDQLSDYERLQKGLCFMESVYKTHALHEAPA